MYLNLNISIQYMEQKGSAIGMGRGAARRHHGRGQEGKRLIGKRSLPVAILQQEGGMRAVRTWGGRGGGEVPRNQKAKLCEGSGSTR
jgi:hypothetical protein